MKKVLLLLFLIIFNFQFSQAQITFQKIYYTIPWSIGTVVYDLKQDIDGYIVTGSYAGSYIYRQFLMKIGFNGDTLWTKIYIDSSSFGGYAVIQTCDSQYLSIGDNLIKTNRNGDTVWTKTYNNITTGCKTNDCGYILAGASNFFGAGGYDFLIIKTDSLGNFLWSKTYGGTGDEWPSSIQQTSDGGYIITGTAKSFSMGNDYIYVIKTDANGDTLWTRAYGGTVQQASDHSSIEQTYDNGYIITGSTSAACLIKIDSNGNVIWSKTYGGWRQGNSVKQTPDSGYIFTGDGFPGGCSGGNDSCPNVLVKTDKNGNIIWARSFFTEKYHYAYVVEQTNDGGFMIGGNSIIHPGYSSLYFIKTDTAGHSGCQELNPVISVSSSSTLSLSTATVVTSPNPTVTNPSISVGNMSIGLYTPCTTGVEEELYNKASVYPNLIPKDGSVDLFIDDNLKGAIVTVFDLIGQPIYSEVLKEDQKKVILSIWHNLGTGIYFIRIMKGEKMMVRKIVVM